jgi:hypothetical protein
MGMISLGAIFLDVKERIKTISTHSSLVEKTKRSRYGLVVSSVEQNEASTESLAKPNIKK